MVTLPGVTGFTLDFDTASRCVKCGADRPAEGRRIVSEKSERGVTFVVRSETPCECGERRIKVSFRVGS